MLFCLLPDSSSYSCTAAVINHTQFSNDDNNVIANQCSANAVNVVPLVMITLRKLENILILYTLGQFFDTIYFRLRRLLETYKLCLLVVFLWV